MKDDDVARRKDAAQATPVRGELVRAAAARQRRPDRAAAGRGPRSPRPAPPSCGPAPSSPARPTDPADPPAPGRTTVSEAGRGRARAATQGAPRPAGDDDADRAPHRAAQPHRQGAAALLVATAVAFWWYEHGLGEFIRAPYCRLRRRPPLRRRRLRLRPAHHRRLRRRLHPAEGRLPGRRGAVRAVLAVPALGVHHARASSATRSATGSPSSPSPRCCSPSARCWPTSRWPPGLELLLSPGRRRRRHRAHRAGLHRLRAVPAGRVRGQLRGAADRGRAQPRRRPELRGAQQAAGAGSSS